jgi:hypothetical protein
MGLLIFAWGIYTELQNCYVSNGPWPLPFPITELVSKARKKWLQLSAIIYNTSNGDVRRLYYYDEIKSKRCLSYTVILITKC